MNSEIPDNVINKKLYQKAINTVYPRYKRPSAYRSMALQKEYMKLGGKYKEPKKEPKMSKLERWRKEKWVSVKDYLEGKIINCGDDQIGNNACRPTKRVDSKTPITIQEVIKKHSKPKVKIAVDKKIKNMNKTLNWKTLVLK